MPQQVIDDPAEVATRAAYLACPTDKQGMPKLDRPDVAVMIAAALRAYLEHLTQELP